MVNKWEHYFQQVFNNGKYHKLIISFFAFFIYANTTLNQFCVDDSIVITKNEYVTKGFSGIPNILNKDTFRGFFKKEGKDKLVSGGRYRPLTLVAFAILYQCVGANPFMFHLLCILCFILLCNFIYLVLLQLFRNQKLVSPIALAFLSTLFFVGHPIHTECVANIKGLDEVAALLFSILSFHFILKWCDNNKPFHLILSMVFLFLGLMSKENTISFLVLIPFATILFYKTSMGKTFKIFSALLLPVLIFLLIRGSILGWNPVEGISGELMNNPFLKFTNGKYVSMNLGERIGTISYTLVRYIGLLFIPHPLTSDYYPKHIVMHTMSSPISILGFLGYISFIIMGMIQLKRNQIISFSIFLYLIPLFIVSNLVFSVGTLMGERFLFMSSLGFCILLAYVLLKYLNKTQVLWFSSIILFLYSVKTIARNMDWKDDRTIIFTDVKTSSNSAKINNAAGAVLLEDVMKDRESKASQVSLERAIKYLKKALEIHPKYFDANRLLGNAYFFKKEYSQAIAYYSEVLKYLPGDEESLTNLNITYREYARQLGMEQNNPTLAIEYLNKALVLEPNDQLTLNLLGVAYGTLSNYPKALEYFNRVLQLAPNSADSYFNLYLTYSNSGDKQKAAEFLMKAQNLDPNILSKYQGVK